MSTSSLLAGRREDLSVSERTVKHAAWERASNEKVRRAAIVKYAAGHIAANASVVERRREALVRLYASESAYYESALADRIETSEARAKRLIVDARQLAAARESSRAAFAAAQYDKLWKESCDQLRTIDTAAHTVHCNDHVALQRTANVISAERRLADERLWAAEWEDSRRRRVEAEDAASKQRAAAVAATRQALSEQIASHRSAADERRQQRSQENASLSAQLAAEAKASEEKARALDEAKRRAYEANAADNERIRRERVESERRRKAAAADALSADMSAFNAEQSAINERAAAERRAMAAYAQLKAAHTDFAQRERARQDALIQEEVDRAHGEREMAWAHEAAMRSALQQDVLATRARQVDDVRRARADADAAKAAERERIERELRLFREEEKTAQVSATRQRRQRREDLEAQISAIAAARAAAAAESAREVEAAAEAEREYSEKLTQYKRECIAASEAAYGVAAGRIAEQRS